MNRIIIALLSLIMTAPFQTMALSVSFKGTPMNVITVTPARSTGLDAIYVVYDMARIESMDLEGIESPGRFRLSAYSNLGGGYAQEVAAIIHGTTASLASPDGNLGYIAEDGDRQYCFWVTDYASYRMELSSVTAFNGDQDCETTRIEAVGKADPIRYFSINGRQNTLSREIDVRYNTLEWDQEQKAYISTEKNVSLEALENPISIRPALLCPSSIRMSGDRFLREWGEEISVESGVIQPNGIEVHTEAVQNNLSDDEDSNMIKGDESKLGGSAPADFTFFAYVTDAVIHDEWQIASDPDFEYIIYRFNERDLNYTFNEEGQYYVRFVGSNDDGSCEAFGDTYEIGIGASELRIPNAFSPDGDGVNDIWKVGYRSLIEFRCWIFDRNGNQLYYFDRPEDGWDGKYKGKIVGPGVYFYVIEATGADGRKYKQGGDINIIRYRKFGNQNSTAPE